MSDIETDSQALTSAINIISAQDRLLAAYRTGGRNPGPAIDRLKYERPRLDAYLAYGRKEATK